MKKNKMMRLASAMMVLTLMSTSVISGTFAKYVTQDSASDSARVAKWGVEVVVEGSDLFSDKYEDGNETVVSSVVNEDVVAPGTKNDEGVKFTLKGKPEVDVNVSITVEEVKDVFLKAGSYADMTTGNDKDYFTFNTDYYPVVFTLSNGSGTELKSGKLTEIKTYLEGLSKKCEANTDLGSSALGTGIDGEYVLTWAWEFPTAEDKETDQKDTLLGNLAADSALKVKYVTNKFYPVAVNQEYCNDISFKVTITVTQID